MVQGADATLKPPQARSHNAVIVRNVADTVLEFAEALNQNNLYSSSLPRFEVMEPELDSDALPTACEAKEAQLTPTETQWAQPDIMDSQAAGVAQAAAMPKGEPSPKEGSAIPATSHSVAYAQHSYDPGPPTYL